MDNQKLQLIRVSMATLLSVAALSACGPSHYDTRGGTDGLGGAPNLQGASSSPQGQGPMVFRDATKDPSSQPGTTRFAGVTNTAGPAAAPAGDNGLSAPDGAAPARHNLCSDKYDPKVQLPEDLVCARCETGHEKQDSPGQVQLDILFVADSSPSLTDTRESIANSVADFVQQLPGGTDYRFAVLPAQSDKTYDDKNKPSTRLGGKLFAHSGEPVVLTREHYPNMSDLSRALASKITRIPLDAATDGGEAGLYSLDLAISEPLLSQNRRAGFFRPSASLAVIFISDENDICSYGVNYPAGATPKVNPDNYPSGKLNPTPQCQAIANQPSWVRAAQGCQVSVEEKANQFFCRDKNGNPTITSQSVYAKLRKLMGTQTDPAKSNSLILSGILYTDPSTVPTTMPPNEPFPQYFGEKEMAYGYLDLVTANGDKAVDISRANYKDGLSKIGKQAAFKLSTKNNYQLKEGAAVDQNTICVLVNGREAKRVDALNDSAEGFTYVYDGNSRNIHLQSVGPTGAANGRASAVDIFYCEPPSVMNANPEKYSRFDLPSLAEHYRNIPLPSGCTTVKSRIQSGALDNG